MSDPLIARAVATLVNYYRRVTRHKSALDKSVARCVAVTNAYREHAGSTRQREEAAK
jgi:hypothetical protein